MKHLQVTPSNSAGLASTGLLWQASAFVIKYTVLHTVPNVALCPVGLLPFLVNNLRNPSLQCKAAALHMVSLTLSAQIGLPLIEAAHLLSPYTNATISDAKMSSNSIKAQTFIMRSFATLEEVLHSETSGD